MIVEAELELLGIVGGHDEAEFFCHSTLEEIGAEFKLTRERIRQLQEQALRRLREEMEERDRPAHETKLALALAA